MIKATIDTNNNYMIHYSGCAQENKEKETHKMRMAVKTIIALSLLLIGTSSLYAEEPGSQEKKLSPLEQIRAVETAKEAQEWLRKKGLKLFCFNIKDCVSIKNRVEKNQVLFDTFKAVTDSGGTISCIDNFLVADTIIRIDCRASDEKIIDYITKPPEENEKR